MIIVLAGAGSSTAVSRSDYPTTVEFFEGLPQEIHDDTLFNLTLDYLRHSNEGDHTPDIENVLWALGEVQRACQSFTGPSGAAAYFFTQNRILNAITSNHDMIVPLSVLSETLHRIEQLTRKINRRVFELYKKLPTHEALSGNWFPLLEGIQRLDKRVEVFTTNYDRVIERAELFRPIGLESGRFNDIDSKLDCHWWETDFAAYEARLKSAERTGLLTKLHGSIDWSRDGDRIYCGSPVPREHDHEQVIIYPGYKGEPTERPFVSFHSHFERCVPRADAILVIGFAFRDEALSRVLKTYRTSTTPLLILNPAGSLPALNAIGGQSVHIKERFDSDGVRLILDQLSQTLKTNSSRSY